MSGLPLPGSAIGQFCWGALTPQGSEATVELWGKDGDRQPLIPTPALTALSSGRAIASGGLSRIHLSASCLSPALLGRSNYPLVGSGGRGRNVTPSLGRLHALPSPHPPQLGLLQTPPSSFNPNVQVETRKLRSSHCGSVD